MNKIAEFRESLGITQAQLCNELGWRQSRLSNYETGARQVGIEDAKKIIVALKKFGSTVSLEQLFS